VVREDIEDVRLVDGRAHRSIKKKKARSCCASKKTAPAVSRRTPHLALARHSRSLLD